MKFSINKQQFLEKLNIVLKAMASKSNMPALMGILMSCENGVLTMVTSNTEISIKVTVNDPSLRIENDGKCLIPGDRFPEVVRKINDDEIKFELAEDNNLVVRGGASDMSFVLYDVEDYPNINFDLDREPIKIKASLLKEIIKQTTFATDPTSKKIILTGVNIRIKDGVILGVSTDSYRISKRDSKLEGETGEVNVIIPAKSLNDLNKILENEGSIVEMLVSSNKVLFRTENMMFQTRLIEGSYPDAIRLIPKDFSVVLKFNKSELMSSIDRVGTMSSGSQTIVVKMNIDASGRVSLTSGTPELGTIRDVIQPKEVIKSEQYQIAFSAGYFMDALRAFNSQDVYMKFSGEIRSFIFESDNDEGLVEFMLSRRSD